MSTTAAMVTSADFEEIGINAPVKGPSLFLSLLTSRPVWTIADQGVVSLGNFLSGVIVARSLSQSAYGAYALLLETMLFLNSLQAAVVTYPMSVRGATQERGKMRQFGAAALWMTFALLPILGLAMGIGVLVGVNRDAIPAHFALAVAAVAAMLLWQVQETTRRGLMSELRFAQCIPGDALSYLGQVALLAMLAWSRSLTLPLAFAIIGVTSALAAVLQAAQLGVVWVSFAELIAIARDFWKLGSWTLLANLAMFVTTIGYTWTLKIFSGLEVTAAFAAILVPLRLVNPMLMGVGNLLVPAVAIIAKRDGARATVPAAVKYGSLGGLAIFSYYGLLCAFPTFALRLIFGAHSPYLHEANMLRFYLLNVSLIYVESVFLSWLYGLGKSRDNFINQIIQAVVTMAIALPATAIYGLPGLIAGASAGTACCVIVQFVMLRKALRPRTVPISLPIRSFSESLPAPDRSVARRPTAMAPQQ